MATPANQNPTPFGTRAIGRCPTCGTMFDMRGLTIVAEQGQNVLTHVECTSCATAVLSVFSVERGALTARGHMTDLTAAEVPELEIGDVISSDQVLEFYAYLEGDRGLTDLANLTKHTDHT